MAAVQAVQKLDALLEAGSRELLVWQAAVRNSGLLDCDLRPSRFDSQTRLLPTPPLAHRRSCQIDLPLCPP